MKKVLTAVSYITLGVVVGLLIGSTTQHRTRHVDTEYFIELKGNSAIIEGLDRHTYFCPIDSIPSVLIKDNL
jgi:hypothetical protein